MDDELREKIDAKVRELHDLVRSSGSSIICAVRIDDDICIGHNLCCMPHACELLENVAEQLSVAADSNGNFPPSAPTTSRMH